MWHHVRKDLQQQALYLVWAHGHLEVEAEATRIQRFANVFPGVAGSTTAGVLAAPGLGALLRRRAAR
ncbi:hypothetical protein BLA24_08095 [Streptomyces cinnamoneus]|uniref:Uncharacterized protein n=1 Tax=Streptomyces cinnamoneus TaxID=53446 RepID=A0A2G1XM99_STRCJ|nr:hypothetical protein [Streptomyces cinnamoneus]PHQ52394.1 hypothetical protein BLA24_08095 [Streptomyces cinnamoneus]